MAHSSHRLQRAISVLSVSMAVLLLTSAPAQAVDTYANYADLAAHETIGVDYRIRVTNRHTDLVIGTPHGGGIEAGTSELVRAIAGEDETGTDWSEYRFEGIKTTGNSALHITSTNFDEPWCLWLITHSTRAVTIHGTSGTGPITYVGGLDVLVRDRVIAGLTAAGFTAQIATGELAGTESANIVNRSMAGAGVQLEITSAQRDSFFGTNTSAQRWNTRTATFESYVAAVRSAVSVDSMSLG
jgi:phage replication-related protein YjqB (UPF0714/DUF867 family)